MTPSGLPQKAIKRQLLAAWQRCPQALLVSGMQRPASVAMGQFNREPLFLLRGLSYMRESPPRRADSPQERIGGVDGGDGWLSKNRDLTFDRRKRGQAFQPGMAW
jgi:hypothetical protein